MSKLLTVAIPTLTERRTIFLPKLDYYNNLLKRQGLENLVEIITYEDNREITIGEKRNLLVDKAKGEMISFVDDDDDISEDYFKLITEAILRSNNTLDAIQIFCYVVNKSNERYNTYVFKGLEKNFIKSLPLRDRNTNKFTNSKISQLNPIKTSLVKSVKYPNIPIHEDLIFCLNIQPKIKKVDTIFKNIYTYYYDTNTSAIQEYRKPETVLLQKLNELYTNEKQLLQYDSRTGIITDPRYFYILENFKNI